MKSKAVRERFWLGSVPPDIQPTAVVIFGATGDLTHRKIVPAFYHLAKNKKLPEDFVIVGFARRPKTDDEFRKDLKEALDQFSHTQPVGNAVWEKLEKHIYYFQGDLPDPSAYQQLAEKLKSLPESAAIGGRYLFYLATAPNFFGVVAENLSKAGLAPREDTNGKRRLIVEKPFGEDLASAQQLNQTLNRYFPEKTVFRIDHYLGKETVQNLLYFRFANSIYEPLWNRRYVDHVQITVAEKVGVEGRGGYYDTSGASRDMLQNHLLQLLTLTAMEPPSRLEADAIHDEKVKVLRSIPNIPQEKIRQRVVRAQYSGGKVEGKAIPAYREEDRVSPHSMTETYVALKLEIDNWRWAGVPFYLRTGKALTRQFSEIDIVFNRPPSVLFAAATHGKLKRNCLRIRIQPNEGIHLNFNAKVPAQPMVQLVEMGFDYRDNFEAVHYMPEAYERLLVDALVGESTLSTRRDEVEEAWRLVDCIRSAWDGEKLTELPLYAAGTMGPRESDELLNRDEHYWILPTD